MIEAMHIEGINTLRLRTICVYCCTVCGFKEIHADEIPCVGENAQIGIWILDPLIRRLEHSDNKTWITLHFITLE